MTRIDQEYRMMFRRFLVLFFVLFIVILFGAAGYRLIEGWSFSDGAYMTIITIFTVGFKEVGDLSGAGRVFTTVLILLGMAFVTSWAATITSFLVSSDLTNYFRRRKMIEKIMHMNRHTVLCGGGCTGAAVITELTAKKTDVVVIEHNAETIKNLEYKFPALAAIEGNATSEETLWLANIKAAKNLVTCLATDVDNLFVVITARDLNPNLFIVSRAFSDSSAQRILKAGADEVVLPNKIGGQKMAEICSTKAR